MSNYKLIACDLDGTLYNNKTQISRENIDAIKKLCERGILFVPSSGRTMSEMPPELINNSDIRYYIYSNGAAAIDTLTGEKILMCMSKAIVGKVLDTLYSYKTHITLRHNGICYIDAEYQKESDYRFYNVHNVHKGVITEYAVLKEGYKEFVYSLDDVEVMSIFFHSETEMQKCKQQLSDIGEIVVADSWPYNLEIFSKSAGKGAALTALAKKLGIDVSQTIGVGDSGNDLTLIKDAGLGLAVDNASDSLKEVCDKIICSNEQHAIKYIVENII